MEKNYTQLNIGGEKRRVDFNSHFANLVKINQSLRQGVLKHYQRIGLTYVDVPEIVGITGACENIDTLFKIQNRLSLPLFFTQTGQLSLEQSLQSFAGACTIINSSRDEELEDARHLRQFKLIEEEFGCSLAGMTRKNYDEEKMYEKLLNHIEMAIKAMIREVLENNSQVLQKFYRRRLKTLQAAINQPFFRISYEEAVEILNANGYPQIKFGDDLKAEHEALIVSQLNKKDGEGPVFIMKYPKEIKFFNMKTSSRYPRLALSADLIFSYAGEGVGSAVREHEFEKLNRRLLESQMYKLHLKRGGKYRDYKWYLDIVKNKLTNPHAGYGIGNERVLQYILAEKDIRNVSIYSLLNRQTGDWNKSRYGTAAIISRDPKQILLSIGRRENKNLLLPSIKKLSEYRQFVLHATEGTHKFLKKHGINTSLASKISQKKNGVNIATLLRRRVFDLVINIPSRGKPSVKSELTDGKVIRREAVKKSIPLFTDCEVAIMVINNLTNTVFL